MTDKPLILVTNDDGINSPGLAAAAAAVDPLGDLLIVAPAIQQTGAGRSMPHHHDGRIFEAVVKRTDATWAAYSAHASPAQAVQHAVLELAARPISLAVSGINFGENVGVSVTISGTVGAALEAAGWGIPALAVSLQVDDPRMHIHYDASVDFAAAIHFTRLDRQPYYIAVPPKRESLGDVGRVGYRMAMDRPLGDGSTDTDAVLAGIVSVTPLSLDMTSRVDPPQLHRILEKTDKIPRK